jgi:hypothetical protein
MILNIITSMFLFSILAVKTLFYHTSEPVVEGNFAFSEVGIPPRRIPPHPGTQGQRV